MTEAAWNVFGERLCDALI